MNFFSQPNSQPKNLKYHFNEDKKSQKQRRLNVSLQNQAQIQVNQIAPFQKTKLPSSLQESSFRLLSSQCVNFCGVNQENKQKIKSEVLFNDQHQGQQEETYRKHQKSFRKKSDYLYGLGYSKPPTPISKIAHIDQDINSKKIKSRGIMLISSLIKPGKNDHKYQSTNVSNNSSIVSGKIH